MHYTTDELMIVAAAREIKDREVVFVGTGLPMLAGYLAKATHAPGANLLFESGIIDPEPIHLATGVGDFRLLKGLAKATSLSYVLGLLQAGYVDVGFLGAAEIDRYGNVNSTYIGGTYTRPKLRLPGSGGANDIASNAKRTLIIVPHQKRKFKNVLTYLTTPGYLGGGDARERAGLVGGGPARVITDKAVLGFEQDTKAMTVLSLHPGVTFEEVQEATEFPLGAAPGLAETPPPTEREVEWIRNMDRNGVYINKDKLG